MPARRMSSDAPLENSIASGTGAMSPTGQFGNAPLPFRSFYLPAYIRYGLRHRDKGTIDSAIYALDPAGIRQHERITEERFGILNARQVRAVCSFLLFASQSDHWCDHVVAKEALDDYWRERGGV